MDHITISLISVLTAIVIGFGFGIIVYKMKKARVFIEQFFGILRIIPSLAVLFILIPIIGTGVVPSVIALILLAIPPILINTVQGFISIPKATIEAATGMGMNKMEVFYKIKLPLAFPLFFAGIRTATIEVISSATLASYIGAGGLGDIIFTGLSLLRYDLLLIGGFSVAFLSLFIGFMLDLVYKKFTKYQMV
ncbi:glycine betaine/L-proline ABC transporter, permease subunit [Campylobacter blaseri]|uniref:Glycine/betaine ABC transporter permease n=1 Tax=Campylobacter blaseri TaxID=2042961 RepID=A0A2P8R0D5_9BACT|nr:ABC transporter permease [Campylobacter blaseri]PSM51956.1 glycine/betaine ABC transporter permease [Campylobacter blaseri]PSM53741.1 glycine/betaine ABC transporter permease [Campylobacter blaseri]QKF85703.1 glycine betaine/L-proline ABC transporter, permease subunit [Campylobacter blaseri]